jgi:hypothetical protein
VRELAEHRPSFDLGFSQVEETLTEQKDSEHAVDAQAVPDRALADQTVGQQPVAEQALSEQALTEQALPEKSVPNQQNVMERPEEDSEVQELVVISSNDDSGDSLDKIYASIEMPSSSGKGIVLQNARTSPRTPGSTTPIPQTRRIVKLGPHQKSPFIANAKKPSVPKSDSELYDKVCMYGGKTKDTLNGERIIDYGDFYISLSDLADSVKPGGWLSNSTCEIALQALSTEMAKQKKFVMPLRIAVSALPRILFPFNVSIFPVLPLASVVPFVSVLPFSCTVIVFFNEVVPFCSSSILSVVSLFFNVLSSCFLPYADKTQKCCHLFDG